VSDEVVCNACNCWDARGFVGQTCEVCEEGTLELQIPEVLRGYCLCGTAFYEYHLPVLCELCGMGAFYKPLSPTIMQEALPLQSSEAPLLSEPCGHRPGQNCILNSATVCTWCGKDYRSPHDGLEAS